MNIAFPALFLFILILPGIICRRAYYATEKTILSHQPFTVEGAISIVLAIPLHLLWILITEIVSRVFTIDLSVNILHVFSLVSFASENFTEKALVNASSNIYPISIYFISLYIFSWVTGTGIRYYVQKRQLDINGPLSTIFKFDTPWYYLFKGVVTKKNVNSNGKTKREFLSGSDRYIQVTCAVTRPDHTYLYVGALDKFYFKRDGSLDRIVLAAASRRKIEDDDAAKDQANLSLPPFYLIEGHALVLKYDDISSLNINSKKIPARIDPEKSQTKNNIFGEIELRKPSSSP